MNRYFGRIWTAAPLALALQFLIATLCMAADDKRRALEGDFVLVNGNKLWYASEGKGPPLIIIAGGPGMSHAYLYPYFSPLADTQRVIYFDAFGRGKSDRAKSRKEYTFDRDVEDVEGLRKALGLGKINLLGHSYGTLVAQAYALRYPGSVNKLVLANSYISAEAWQGGQDEVNDAIKDFFPEEWAKVEQLRAQGFRSSAQEHQEALFAVPYVALCCVADPARAKTLPPENVPEPDIYYTIPGADADFVAGGDIAKLDFRQQLKNIKAPTLILAGRFDRFVPTRYTLQYREYMPQAQIVMFEESGHSEFLEEPAKTIEVLRKFLGQ
jgi:proline iminopeptidase